MAKGHENVEKHKLNVIDPERAREIHSMGGKASQKVLKERKTFLQILNMLGESPATTAEKANFSNIFPGMSNEEITKDMMVAAAQYHKAITKFDTQAAAFIRDTKGEKPDTVIKGDMITEKIFIDPDTKKATLEHIQEVIKDGNK